MNNTQALPISDSHNPEDDLIPTAPMIDGVEKHGDWIEHREIVVQELCPFGALETMYAQRAALYLWRLKHLIGFENDASLGGIDVGTENSCEMSQGVSKTTESPDRSKLQTIIKYEAHLVRCLSSTMAELRRLQKERLQGLRDVNPAGRVAVRAGVCRNQEEEEAGSPGGSPSQKSSPMQTGSPIRTGSSAQNQDVLKDGSPGGSPVQDGSASMKRSPMQSGAPIRANSPNQTGSPNQRISTSRKQAASKRASPIPKPPPLLASITNRRRLEEFNLGQTFERNLASATLDFAMIPCR